MAAPNSLVAELQDSTTAITGIGIAESAAEVHQGTAGGSWIEGGLGLAGGGLEALGLITDPIGTLLQYGISWLIEHVKPLSDALDWLAGDPDAIASYAQTWRNVAQPVGQARTELDGAVRIDTAAWTGNAGDAYRAFAAGQSERFTAPSTAAAGTVGTVVEAVGVLVAVVREIVRDLVAECIATLVARGWMRSGTPSSAVFTRPATAAHRLHRPPPAAPRASVPAWCPTRRRPRPATHRRQGRHPAREAGRNPGHLGGERPALRCR
jgi:hypothetical protein